MKKITILLIVAASAAMIVNCGGGPKPDYVITGEIEGADGDIYLMNGKDTVNVAQATDGKFVLTGELPEPGAYMVLTKRLPMMILIDEGDTLNISGSALKFKPGERMFSITGSDANNAFMELGNRLMEILAEVRNAETPEERDLLIQKQTDIVLYTAEQNIDNILGIYLLSVPQQLYETSNESVLAVLDKVPERLKATSLYNTARKQFETLPPEPGNQPE